VEFAVAKAGRNNSVAAHFESKTPKTRRLQPRDFSLPKQLSRDKLSDICEAFKISNRHAAELKEFLDKLVSELRDRKSREYAAIRQGDRDHIVNGRKRITELQDELKWFGIDGTLAVRSTAAR